MDCVEKKGKLIRCVNATEDENGNQNCTKCIYNFPLVWRDEFNGTICDEKCRFDEFLRDSWCYKCDDSSKGNKGCVASLGCNFTVSNKELDCFDCKPGYFLSNFQCLFCKDFDRNSTKCHYDYQNKRVQPDECEFGYYINNETHKCEIITYDEYPEITPGCILSINNKTEYKEIKNMSLYWFNQ